jgi:predicted metal-dependent HD superfamily phosphohydrolase
MFNFMLALNPDGVSRVNASIDHLALSEQLHRPDQAPIAIGVAAPPFLAWCRHLQAEHGAEARLEDTAALLGNTVARQHVDPKKMPELRASWLRAWNGIGARADDATFNALVAGYGEQHRSYHTVQHLHECIKQFDAVQGLALNAAEVETALWFHDAIYDVKRADNEERSAEWASTAARHAGVADATVERIRSMVMVTKHTGAPDVPDEQLLVDIDLSILGANKERFAEYERQIREEYSFVPGWLFRRKRRAILRSFLDRPRIYATAHFHEQLEATARENLQLAIGSGRA